jgi:hypothetical protein
MKDKTQEMQDKPSQPVPQYKKNVKDFRIFASSACP